MGVLYIQLNMTILAKLVAKENDIGGYTTYVFECLDKEALKETKYIMTTRFPNWNHRNLNVGEIGYLSFFEIRAGIDTWFDGEKMVPYKYNNIQFDKFVVKPKKRDNEYIMQINFYKIIYDKNSI